MTAQAQLILFSLGPAVFLIIVVIGRLRGWYHGHQLFWAGWMGGFALCGVLVSVLKLLGLMSLVFVLAGCTPTTGPVTAKEYPKCEWAPYYGANARFNGVNNGQAFGQGYCPPRTP